MEGLYAFHPHPHDLFDSLALPELSGVGEHGNAAGLADGLRRLSRVEALAPDVSGLAPGEVAAEDLAYRGTVPGLDEGLGDVGTADGAASGDLPDACQVYGRAELSEAGDDALVAEVASAAKRAEDRLEGLVVQVDEVSEDVNLVILRSHAELDGGNQRQSCGTGRPGVPWEHMLQRLRYYGLDIVIVFDSTGSMRHEIDAVKKRIKTIGRVLFELVPKTRIGLVTYRDQGDDYVVKGQRLANQIEPVCAFLHGIVAEGGGDAPEAVRRGLAWAMDYNTFRPEARKVILLFGDAPPHRQDQSACRQLAADFRSRYGGLVSTVQCRQVIPAFREIAYKGEGESFSLQDSRELVEHLMVLVFGSHYREKIVEAFAMAGEDVNTNAAKVSPWEGIPGMPSAGRDAAGPR